jgi:hypothetical protein
MELGRQRILCINLLNLINLFNIASNYQIMDQLDLIDPSCELVYICSIDFGGGT